MSFVYLFMIVVFQRACLHRMPFNVTLCLDFIWSFLMPITLIQSGQTTNKQQ